MYPRNAASPQRISVGPVVQISDGAVQTSGVSVKVMPQAGAAGAGGGTIAYEEGVVHYLPTQAETDYASFMVLAYKTGCIPSSVTIVTSASTTAGYAGVDWSKVTAPTTSLNLSGTTIATSQAVASVSGAVGSVTGLTASDVGAIKAKTDNLPASPASTTNITAASGVTLAAVTHTGAVIPTVTTLTGHTAQTGDAFARLGAPAGASLSVDLAAVKTDTAAVKTKTDQLTFSGSMVEANMKKINGTTLVGNGSAPKFGV